MKLTDNMIEFWFWAFAATAMGIILLLLVGGCAVAAPDTFKVEAGLDKKGSYDGMEMGLSWDIPQPKH